MTEQVATLRSPQRLYMRIWRWHFFAALIVIPFVLWQSVTGVLYLWHREIVSLTHAELLVVAPSAARASLDQQLSEVLKQHPAAALRTVEVSADPVVGVYFALIMLVFLFSALPWTTFWGRQVLDPIERALGQQSPNGFFFGGGGGHATHGSHGSAPSLRQPSAGETKSLDELIALARGAGARGQIEVRLLADRSAVNVHDVHARAPDEVWLQLDSSGAVRTRVVWEDFPLIARLVALGVDLHEGTFFGRANQIFNTVVASALIWLCVTGFIGWYRRRPQGGLAPPPKRELRYPRALIATGVTLCVLLPLLAVSLAFIALLDRGFGRFMAREA